MTDSLWRAEDLERIACGVCDDSESDPVYVRPDGMRVVRCRRCGTAYVNPRPRANCIRRLYDAGYFHNKPEDSTDFGFTDYDYFDDSIRPNLWNAAKARLAVVGDFWQPRAKRCLELGCATGEFSALLAECGADVTGMDISNAAIVEASRRYENVRFVVGQIEDLSTDGRFDALFLFEVIEHVLSPSQFILQASRILKPGGILVLTTPNLACGDAVGFDRWLGFQMSFEHLYFFTPAGARLLLGRFGFRVEKWWTGGGDGVSRPKPVTRTRWRTMIRALLGRIGLLRPYRAFRRKLAASRATGYLPEGKMHNLYILAVRDEPSSDAERGLNSR